MNFTPSDGNEARAIPILERDRPLVVGGIAIVGLLAAVALGLSLARRRR